MYVCSTHARTVFASNDQSRKRVRAVDNYAQGRETTGSISRKEEEEKERKNRGYAYLYAAIFTRSLAVIRCILGWET